MSSDESADGDGTLGATTVSDRWRIDIIGDVREALAGDGTGVVEGDLLVYGLRDGKIAIESAHKRRIITDLAVVV